MIATFLILGASPALAHGVNEIEAVALQRPAGPYDVSVFISEVDGDRVNVHAALVGDTTVAPAVMVRSALGDAPVQMTAAQSGSGWIAEFVTSSGAELVVTWTDVRSGVVQETAVILASPRPPEWFVGLLGVITFPGLWFGYWLIKRRRRAFGLTPAVASR